MSRLKPSIPETKEAERRIILISLTLILIGVSGFIVNYYAQLLLLVYFFLLILFVATIVSFIIGFILIRRLLK